jgi:hypothetical protein
MSGGGKWRQRRRVRRRYKRRRLTGGAIATGGGTPSAVPQAVRTGSGGATTGSTGGAICDRRKPGLRRRRCRRDHRDWRHHGNPRSGDLWSPVLTCQARPKSPLYSVTVTGKPLFVEKMTKFSPEMQVHYAHGSLVRGRHCDHRGDGQRDLQLVQGESQEPAAFRHQERQHRHLRQRPQLPDLQFDAKELLFILLDAEETNPPKVGDANVKSLADYTVDNTGATLVTSKIQSAINAASGATQNILYVPPGKYKVGELWLKSNMTLYLACGAIIYGSSSTGDFNTGSGGINIEGAALVDSDVSNQEYEDLGSRGSRCQWSRHPRRGPQCQPAEDRAELQYYRGWDRGREIRATGTRSSTGAIR